MDEGGSMCLIVDADRMGLFLATPEHTDAKPIHTWLRRGVGRLVYSTGGKFDSEVYRRARERLAAYARAGRAKFFPEDAFRPDVRRLNAAGMLRSNDAHVLALARASRTRPLYTGDDKLKADFKNAQIISDPRGKIYSGARNQKLLNTNACPT